MEPWMMPFDFGIDQNYAPGVTTVPPGMGAVQPAAVPAPPPVPQWAMTPGLMSGTGIFEPTPPRAPVAGVPLPRPAPGMPAVSGPPMDASSITAPGAGSSPAAQGPDKLLQTLRGVQAPKPPDVVKPSTPALPRPTPIQAGQLFAMLQALGQPNPVQNSINPTLMQAIGGR